MDSRSCDRRLFASIARRAPATSSSEPVPTAYVWRCRTCNALLGIEQQGELHVKYKGVDHWITGRCRHVCRRCGTMNRLDVGAAPNPPPPPEEALAREVRA